LLLELIHIGHSAKSRGIAGKFKARIKDQFKADAAKARAIFINLKGSKVPFLLESMEDHGHMVIKVEEIDTPEAVSQLLSKELYLDIKEISDPSLLISDNTNHQLVGYQLIDQNKNSLGDILEIIQYPDQLLAKIVINTKEILIPIHEDLILDLIEEHKIIQLEIVDGLLEL